MDTTLSVPVSMAIIPIIHMVIFGGIIYKFKLKPRTPAFNVAFLSLLTSIIAIEITFIV